MIENWYIYKGKTEKGTIEEIENKQEQPWPDPPPWRPNKFNGELAPWNAYNTKIRERSREDKRGGKYLTGDEERRVVNAALYLRRPILITGKPGTGKSTLAYSVAFELNLGPVLHWPISTHSTVQQGLYHYDAIGRLHQASLSKNVGGQPNNVDEEIGQFLRLGSLGTSLLPSDRPRVLLIDEIDKSDIDFPNDLLNIFEEGEFVIPELARLAKVKKKNEVMVGAYDEEELMVPVLNGKIQAKEFPLVIMTSNGEREFPPAFLRRCLRIRIIPPDQKTLTRIVESHFDSNRQILDQANELIEKFVEFRDKKGETLATDQLLNAIFLLSHKIEQTDRQELLKILFKSLDSMEVQ